MYSFFFFFQAEDGIRDKLVTGVQTCALPIYLEEVEVIQTQARASPQDLGLALARRLPLLHLEQPVAGGVGRTDIPQDDFFLRGGGLHPAGGLFYSGPVVLNWLDGGKQQGGGGGGRRWGDFVLWLRS